MTMPKFDLVMTALTEKLGYTPNAAIDESLATIPVIIDGIWLHQEPVGKPLREYTFYVLPEPIGRAADVIVVGEYYISASSRTRKLVELLDHLAKAITIAQGQGFYYEVDGLKKGLPPNHQFVYWSSLDPELTKHIKKDARPWWSKDSHSLTVTFDSTKSEPSSPSFVQITVPPRLIEPDPKKRSEKEAEEKKREREAYQQGKRATRILEDFHKWLTYRREGVEKDQRRAVNDKNWGTAEYCDVRLYELTAMVERLQRLGYSK